MIRSAAAVGGCGRPDLRGKYTPGGIRSPLSDSHGARSPGVCHLGQRQAPRRLVLSGRQSLDG